MARFDTQSKRRDIVMTRSSKMPLDKNDLKQIRAVVHDEVTTIVDKKITASEQRLTKVIDEKIGATEARLTNTIDEKIESLAVITKHGFDNVTKDITDIKADVVKIKQEQRAHDFKVSETVTRSEHFQLQERVKKTNSN